MKNKFTFRPVGQGLFYTGSLWNYKFNFIYDCGTENNQQLLKKQVNYFYKEISYYVKKNNPLILLLFYICIKIILADYMK